LLRRLRRGNDPRRRRFTRLVLESLDARIVPSAPTINEFNLVTGSTPESITAGPDGNLWFTGFGNDRIGEINAATHAISENFLPFNEPRPVGITTGPDGNVWFTRPVAQGVGPNVIGVILSTTHQVFEFSIPTLNCYARDITTGPDGNLWFTESVAGKIGEINPHTHAISEFATPIGNGDPTDIAAGPDGNLWFTEYLAGRIGEINPSTHAIREFDIPTPASYPVGITAGPDGNVWFTESAGAIGWIDPNTHAISEFNTPTLSHSRPLGITAGPDGNVWFTEDNSSLGGGRIDKIGQINPNTHAVSEFATPTANSGPNGITVGPDGNLWFTEQAADNIGEVIVPPVVTSLSQTSAAEGSSISLTVNGANFAQGATVDWSGAALNTTVVSSSQLQAIIPFIDLAEEGSGNITVVNSANSTSNAVVFTVSDAPLPASPIIVTATEGVVVPGNVVTFRDTDPNGTAADYTATITWGDGHTSNGTVTQITRLAPLFAVSGTNTYAEEGNYTVSVVIRDAGGSTVSASGTATVSDAALSASPVMLGATEGTAFRGPVATFTDADPNSTAADYTATITWGDGHTSNGTVTANGNGGFNVAGANTYTEEGSDTLSVVIRDAGGSTASPSGTATVSDAALSASPVTFAVTAGVLSPDVLATFTEADPNATAADYTATITWDAGHTSTGTVTANGSGGFNVAGTYSYAAEGRYNALVTVTDTGGSLANATSLVHVARIGPPPSSLTTVSSIFTHSAESYSLFVTAAYQRYLGRSPDSQGLSGWVGAMQNGLSDEHLEADFIGSGEYIQRHGGLGAAWITAMYQNLLNRTPAQQEVNGWVTALNNGQMPSDIAYLFAASPEREGIRVRADYQNYLGRTPNETEVNGWVAAFESRTFTNEDVVAEFVASPEYFQRHYNNVADWLFSAYHDILGRTPDAAGYAAWLAYLRAG
jgi:streptogramin lyase